MELTSAEDVYMGEVVGQLGVQITPLRGVHPIWQEFCNVSEEGVTPQWTVIHWLDPPRMVSYSGQHSVYWSVLCNVLFGLSKRLT